MLKMSFNYNIQYCTNIVNRRVIVLYENDRNKIQPEKYYCMYKEVFIHDYVKFSCTWLNFTSLRDDYSHELRFVRRVILWHLNCR